MKHAAPTSSTTPPVPEAISRWAAKHHYLVDAFVRQNKRGGITARLVRDEHPTCYAKFSHDDLLDEAERLSWLHSRFPSPAMADYLEADDGNLIVTLSLPGQSAAASKWTRSPAIVAHAMGEALSRLHSLDPSECLFDPPAWITDDIGDRVVVLHGGLCVSSTLLTDEGHFQGIIDVGRLGPGDPYADIAAALFSLEQSYGTGLEKAFFSGYGTAPERDQIDHYLAMWDASLQNS